MDIDAILALVAPIPLIKFVLMALGALVVAGYSYVKITPSQDDDAWFAKLEAHPILGPVLKSLIKFSPIARKE